MKNKKDIREFYEIIRRWRDEHLLKPLAQLIESFISTVNYSNQSIQSVYQQRNKESEEMLESFFYSLNDQNQSIDQNRQEQFSKTFSDTVHRLPTITIVVPSRYRQDYQEYISLTKSFVCQDNNSIGIWGPTAPFVLMVLFTLEWNSLRKFAEYNNVDIERIQRIWKHIRMVHGHTPRAMNNIRLASLRAMVFIDNLIASVIKAKRCRIVDLLSAEEVYLKGYEFYSQHASPYSKYGLTLTFSTTSGLADPLEQLGYHEFAKKFFDGDENAAQAVMGAKRIMKNSLRKLNFTEGILSEQFAVKRVYVWDDTSTGKRFVENYLKMRQCGKGELYLQEAVSILTKALSHRRIWIVRLRTFSPWMKLWTRVGTRWCMFSFRDKETRKIAHALWLDPAVYAIVTIIKKKTANILGTISKIAQNAWLNVALKILGLDGIPPDSISGTMAFLLLGQLLEEFKNVLRIRLPSLHFINSLQSMISRHLDLTNVLETFKTIDQTIEILQPMPGKDAQRKAEQIVQQWLDQFAAQPSET